MTPQWLPMMMAPLASRFYTSLGQKEKVRRDERVAVMRDPNGVIQAALRISPREEHWVLRALLVAPDHRRQGLAAKLLAFALAELESPLWCFAYPELSGLYLEAGFVEAKACQAPAAIVGPFSAYSRHRPLLLMRFEK